MSTSIAPQGVAALVDDIAPAKLANAVPAADPGAHDRALPLRRRLLPGRPPVYFAPSRPPLFLGHWFLG
jgi:hypothetical protein